MKIVFIIAIIIIFLLLTIHYNFYDFRNFYKVENFEHILEQENLIYQNRVHDINRAARDVRQRYARLIRRNREDEFVINRANDFVQNVNELFWVGLDAVVPESEVEQIAEKLANALVEATKTIPSKTKQEKFENYTELAQNNTNDPQNVHDTSVNKDLKRIYQKIANTPRKQSVDDLRQYVKQSNLSSQNKQTTQKVINAMWNDFTVYPLKVKEKDVLLNMWNRAILVDEDRAVQNTSNSDFDSNLAKDAFVQSIIDCNEGGSIVCPNGRCGRIITSLWTIDSAVDTIQTREQYKNALLYKANQILNQEIEEAKKSNDSELKRFGDSFTDMSIDDSNISKLVKQAFFDRIEEKIEQEMIKNPEHYDSTIKREIMIGIKM